MSELADRLRTISGEALLSPYIKGAAAEAAAELDRLGSILGAAAHYTDSDWAAQVAAQMGVEAAAAGPLFPPPSLKPHIGSMVMALNAIGDAVGDWEVLLRDARDGRSSGFKRL